MSARVLVLGAAGRLGHAAAEAFRDAGWSVASLVRPGNASRAPADTEIVEIHALDHAAVAKTAGGADVILHALNPPYTDWSRLALPLAYSARPRRKRQAPHCYSPPISTITARRCRR
jgi:nucleoside-diphosphate-sugar epimerase